MNRSLVSTCVLVFLILVSGCGKTDAPARSRSSSFEPKFEAIERSVKLSTTVSTGFLNDDHFICAAVSGKSLVNNPQFKDIPWDSVEKTLAELVGQNNAKLEALERVWLLLDREAMDMQAQMESSGESPFLMILETNSKVDRDSIDRANDNRNSDTERYSSLLGDKFSKEAPELFAKAISDNHIAIGNGKTLERVAIVSETIAPIHEQMQSLKFTNDLEVAATMVPLRELVDRFMPMMQAAGDFGKSFRRIVQSLQGASGTVSLEGESMLDIVIRFDNSEVAKELVDQDNSKSSEATPFPGMMGNLMPFQGRRAMRVTQQPPKTLFTPTSTDLFQSVAKDIAENDRVKITQDDTSIRISISRPEKLSELIAAGIVDAQRGLNVAQRSFQLRVIAAALEKYVEAHDCYPPVGPIKQDNAAGLPAQFNWRVGLLKYIDPTRYAKIDFGKPWDGPENRKILASAPRAFQTSLDPTGVQSLLQVVGGENGFYRVYQSPDGTVKVDPDSVKDKLKYTAIIVESDLENAQHWASPETKTIGTKTRIGLAAEQGAMFVSGDFKVRIAPRGEILNAVLTANGEETVQRQDLIRTGN